MTELHQQEKAVLDAERARRATRDAPIGTIMAQRLALGETATSFPPGNPGGDLRPGFKPPADDIHRIKHLANAFRETRSDDELKR